MNDDTREDLQDLMNKDPSSLNGKTILVVDDEPALRELLFEMLELMNMKPILAESGQAALDLQEAYQGEIDFLLTDIVMPEMDGVSLGRAFKEVRPNSNVIYMSGQIFDTDTEIEGGGFSMDTFIAKPMHEDHVERVLKRALERRDVREKTESL